MRRTALALAALAGSSILAVGGTARADIEDWTEVPQFTASPEHFGLELRVGVYSVLGLGDGFGDPNYFGGDVGPMLGFELHYFPWRIEYLGLIGAGGGFGWSQWDTEMPGGMAGDRNYFELLAPRAFLVWRIDSLNQYLDIPLAFTPKIGFDFTYWQTGTGDSTEQTGWSIGPRFAGKVSLILDFLEPRAARQLDDEWGINHSEIFFEMYYSMAGDIADSMLSVSGWGWATGIGFTF